MDGWMYVLYTVLVDCIVLSVLYCIQRTSQFHTFEMCKYERYGLLSDINCSSWSSSSSSSSSSPASSSFSSPSLLLRWSDTCLGKSNESLPNASKSYLVIWSFLKCCPDDCSWRNCIVLYCIHRKWADVAIDAHGNLYIIGGKQRILSNLHKIACCSVCNREEWTLDIAWICNCVMSK